MLPYVTLCYLMLPYRMFLCGCQSVGAVILREVLISVFGTAFLIQMYLVLGLVKWLKIIRFCHKHQIDTNFTSQPHEFRVARSVHRLTTGWTVRGSNPGGVRFSARPYRPWGPPSLLYNWYRVFPGGEVRPGRAADHSLPSSPVGMEE